MRVRKFYSSVRTDCQSVWQFYFSVRIHFNKLFIHLNDFANPLETLISLILSNCLCFVDRSLSVHFSHSNLSRSQICMIHIHIHIHDFMSLRYKLEITPWVWNLTPLISSFQKPRSNLMDAFFADLLYLMTAVTSNLMNILTVNVREIAGCMLDACSTHLNYWG